MLIPPGEKIIETRICRLTWKEFIITDKDAEFYAKISPVFNGKKYLIPYPTLCPEARQQRRLAWRNERKLYKRKCDATGKDIVSIFSPNKPFAVYNATFWWSDHWDPMSYGREFDFSRSAFEQFWELMQSVPLPARATDEPNMINSDYCNEAGGIKDSYLCFEVSQSQDALYISEAYGCQSCVDCYYISHSQECFMCIGCTKMYSCQYMLQCMDCSLSEFCAHCIDCTECFQCTNLRNKRYYFKNQPYTKEQWQQLVDEYKQTHTFEQQRADFDQLVSTTRVPPHHNLSTEDCTGDYLVNSQSSYDCFACGDLEGSKYCHGLIAGGKNLDSMDISYFWVGLQQCYDSQGIGGNPGQAFRTLFSMNSWQGSYITYCWWCTPPCHDLFLCSWLRNKQYCILNRQYTKEQYEELVPQIIEKMITDGEWGEFFPASMSPFGYNETVANEYFPLTKDEALKQGFQWSDYEAPFPKAEKIIPWGKLPENIHDIPDDVLNWAIECEITKKPFRIVPAELQFYRKHNLPLPHRHPDQRHKERMAKRNPGILFQRSCMCPTCAIDNNMTNGLPITFQTTYSPDRPESVYCQRCYERSVS